MKFEERLNLSREEYIFKTPKSKLAYREACQYLPGGETRTVAYYAPYPITIEYAKGSKLYDIDGNEYIDCINNYTSLIHGHANPVVENAMIEAIKKGTAAPAGIEEQVELAQILYERIESVKKIRFCNSGTEANLFAIRAARAFTGRNGIIKTLGGYHGSVDWARFNVKPKVNDNTSIDDLLNPISDCPGIPANVGEDLYIVPYNDLDAVEKVLKESASKIACMIVEPFMGSAGVIKAKDGYLAGIRELTSKYGVLLIFDEVQSLRLSSGGAQTKYSIEPDLSSFGKIIGGGLPVGAFGGRSDIMEVYDATKSKHASQSGTFNGNRPTMAAGVAALTLYNHDAVSTLEHKSDYLYKGLKNCIEKKKLPVCITREGSLMNIHFMEEEPTDYVMAQKAKTYLAPLCHIEMLKRGVFLAQRGTIAMSTAMSKEDSNSIIRAFDETLDVISEFLE